MNTPEPQLPAVEIVQVGAQYPQQSLKSRRRVGTFLLVLFLSLAATLVYVFARDTVYRASASVLTVKPKAVDSLSQEADAEHVAIQSRLLKSAELLASVAGTVNERYGSSLVVADLKKSLTTVPITETNLLELRAEGEEPELLQLLVNTWAESYENYRLQEIENLTNDTTAELLDSQAALATEIERAREELRSFRETHEIVSSEREENRSLSAIRGLNKSINAAREKEIDAISRLSAIDEAIARGEDVVPREQKSEIAKMKLDIAHLHDKLSSLRDQFTEAYIERDPQLADLPEVIEELEQDLSRALEIGATTVRNDAVQEVQAARQSVAALERDLTKREASVQTFTQHFKQFKLLEEELSRLESLYADKEERIAKLRVTDNEKYPPLKIIENATLPETPIYPNYQRDALLSAGFSLALALFITWLVEFLSARPEAATTSGNIGIRVHPHPNETNYLTPASTNSTRTLSKPPARLTDETDHQGRFSTLPTHLSTPEISKMISHSSEDIRGYLSLLLSGVTPIELEKLNSRCFDDDHRTIILTGDSARKLHIESFIWREFDSVRQKIDEPLGIPLLEKLDIDLVNLARDLHLSNPSEINALVIWHSYVVYLLEQGIDDDQLFKIVGRIPPEVMHQLHTFSPGEPVAQIELTHPSLLA